MVFILFWDAIFTALLGVPDLASEDSPFLRHEYCGTFFVEINSENSFASHKAYLEYLEKQNSLLEAEPLPTAIIVTADALG